MPTRLVQIVIPAGREAEATELLDGVVPAGRWPLVAPDGGELIQFVVSAHRAEPLTDRFVERFEGVEGFRVTLLTVEASLPAPDEDEEEDEEEFRTGGRGEDDDETGKGQHSRVSRDELRAAAMDSAALGPVYLAMVAASTVVAAVGVIRNDVAVIIGAMVIAPLLGPNMALALAAALADTALARRAAVTNLAGITLAMAISAGVGLLVPVDATVEAIASRTRPATSDMVLALAAGVAGSLAFTSGFPQAVIGVMVAVALLPPLVIFGLLLGAGMPTLAVGAFLLLSLNVISVNLAGVATFLVGGVRPAGWWDAKRARTSVRWAALIWGGLLAALAVVLWVARSQGFGPFAE